MDRCCVAATVAMFALASVSAGCDEPPADEDVVNYEYGYGVGSGGSFGQPNGFGAPGGQALLPCDVAQVLSSNCWECHGTTTRFGAPMPLTTLSHFQALNAGGAQMSQLVTARIHDIARPMPPAPNPPLTPSDMAVIDNWIAGGMQAGSCTMEQPGDVSVGNGDGGGGAVAGGTGGAISDGTGGGPAPVVGEECFTLTAHSGDKVTPYNVPTTPDLYVNFNFTPPWGSGKVHGLKARSLIDNDRAIHHWILYSGGGIQDGGIAEGALGAHAGQFIAGWAPGAQDTIMPEGVGLQIPAGGLELEVHYNAPGPGHTDASGVELCITRELLPNEAATHPLGQEGFRTNGAGTVCGTCNPRGNGPITIISSSPHMHLRGTRMRTTVFRQGGGQETLIDKPFAFDGQIAYDTPMTIMPGDTLETECFYDGSVAYGTGTNEEMCYNFVLAYPAGALAGGGGISNNGNTCIEEFLFGGDGC